MKEIWKEIPSTNGRYIASCLGRIASMVYKFDKKRKSPKIITPYLTEKGYWRCCIRDVSGKNYRPIYRFVHRLIAEAFIPAIEGKEDINHRDGDKNNNTPSNLEWVTPIENNHHAWENGFFDGNLKLNPKQIKEIYHSDLSPLELCDKYRVSYQTIYSIRSAKRKRHFDSQLKSKTNIYVPEDIVKEIFISTESTSDIINKFNVNYHLVWRIKTKRSYSSITNLL